MENLETTEDIDINEIFGSRVFGDTAMRSRMPERVYKSLKETSLLGKPLDPGIADAVATAMKDWAAGLGATHYTHWFQPLNNFTAGKHDAFISHVENGGIVTEFPSKALVQGEPDASSFPSGGLRNTFEARGYTTWDPSSPAFVRDGTLFIPTAFCAYTGEALDTKTPLLRSMQALAPQAMRVLKALGYDAKAIAPTVGAEQEYFLVDREMYEKRLDLKLCGRTLLGARPPKGQELDDHYYGRIRLRVSAFMRELDKELWSYGIMSKTKHNEAAPAQHEMAPIFETVNIACDHDLLTMEVIRMVAKKHGLACLLHEKPFEGVNGSGKHNNFSIQTDNGINFFKPGKCPEENLLFLVTLCALIETADTYAGLIRLSGATAGNDARLGGNEAPPAIISVFLGDAITDMLNNIACGADPSTCREGDFSTGVDILSHLKKDNSDRNRTSPLAFTGNKFEFRMIGASQSIAFCNTVLNTAMADCFFRFGDRLENASDKEREVQLIVSDTMKNHGRVIFNGNNYSPSWVIEAKERGLPVISTTLEAIEELEDEKNIALFEKHGIFTRGECHARYEIMLENFSKIVIIEAETLLQIIRRQIFPVAVAEAGETANALNSMCASGLKNDAVKEHLSKLSGLSNDIYERCERLARACAELPPEPEYRRRARSIQDSVRPAMVALRESCDALETIISSERWPLPTYTDLLHRI